MSSKRWVIFHGMDMTDQDSPAGLVTTDGSDNLLMKVEYPDLPVPPDPNIDPIAWGVTQGWTLKQLLSYMTSYVAVPAEDTRYK